MHLSAVGHVGHVGQNSSAHVARSAQMHLAHLNWDVLYFLTFIDLASLLLLAYVPIFLRWKTSYHLRKFSKINQRLLQDRQEDCNGFFFAQIWPNCIKVTNNSSTNCLKSFFKSLHFRKMFESLFLKYLVAKILVILI